MSEAKAGYISTGGRQLHYLCYGTGPKLLIAFHGYGNSAALFAPFASFIGQEYRLYSIDLPHHGRSEWEAGSQLQKSELATLANNLMNETGTTQCSLMGYSIGGRVCLSIVGQIPDKIEKVLLLAPDGLVFNPLYYFATKNFAGKRLFRNFLTDPKRYLKYINWLRDKNYISASRYNFGMNYLGSAGDREFLLKVWPDLSALVPNSRSLRAAITRHNIPINIFMGEYDKVIPVKHAAQFKKGLSTVSVHIMQKGHRVFDQDTMPQMAKCLLA